jgi:hypothetical protein
LQIGNAKRWYMNDETLDRIRRALDAAREESGKNWEDFAEERGVDVATIWRWREGKIGKGALARVLIPLLVETDCKRPAA